MKTISFTTFSTLCDMAYFAHHALDLASKPDITAGVARRIYNTGYRDIYKALSRSGEDYFTMMLDVLKEVREFSSTGGDRDALEIGYSYFKSIVRVCNIPNFNKVRGLKPHAIRGKIPVNEPKTRSYIERNPRSLQQLFTRWIGFRCQRDVIRSPGQTEKAREIAMAEHQNNF